MEDNRQERKRRFRKAGRTLLLKPIESEFNFDSLNLDNFTGITSNILTKSGARFLVFDNINNATACLKEIKNIDDILVKYAHYRLYFTINGIDESSDYNDIKQAHIDFINKITDTDVLYYKLYKKNKDKFLGCGDLTIDTKHGMDILLSEESKIYSILDGKYTGQFYQYNKFRSSNRDNESPVSEMVKTKSETNTV